MFYFIVEYGLLSTIVTAQLNLNSTQLNSTQLN